MSKCYIYVTSRQILEMKRNILSHGSHEEKRISRKDDRDSLPHSRSEEEKRRRRREWRIQRELEKQHAKLKRKMILEYELKRARELDAARRNSGRSADRNYSKSKSRSRSLEDQHRRDTKATSSKPAVMSGKLDSSCGTTPIFKGPEGTQISVSELRRIKVDIHRNIPVQGKIQELQRDIVNPEDITIIRRKGEGSKPIFEREELKSAASRANEVEEHRTVIALDNGDSVKKTETFKRRSPSFHSVRNRSRSPRPSTSRRSRSKDSQNASYKFDRHSNRRSDRRHSSREKSRESERKYKEYVSSRDRESPSREYKDHRRDSRSSRVDHRDSRRDTHRRGNESRNEDESRARNRSAEGRNRGKERERGRSRSDSRSRFRYREQQMIPSHCIEQVPYPIYYGPRPIMVGPVMPMRGQVPIPRGRLPPSMIGPMRPFPPRFVPPDMYRLGPLPPPNYRFGSMY